MSLFDDDITEKNVCNLLELDDSSVLKLSVGKMEIVKIFCSRVCHDLINPLVALSLMNDSEDVNRVAFKQCLDRALLFLDIFRKTYSVEGMIQDVTEFKKFATDMLEKNVLIIEDGRAGQDKLLPHLQRFFVWLFFKRQDDTSAEVHLHDGYVEVIVRSIIVNDQEKELLVNRASDVDMFNVYLSIFMCYLDNVKMSCNLSTDELKIKLEV